MVKQGGWSYNTNIPSKRGMSGNQSCSECGRRYKQEWTRNNHQVLCEVYNQ